MAGRMSGRERRIAAIAAACGVLALAIAVLALSGRGAGDVPAEGTEAAGMEQEAMAREKDGAQADPAGFRMDAFDEALIEYLCLNGYGRESFAVSPAALRAALCAAAAGAQGNTRTELANAAGFPGMEALDSWRSGLEKAVPGAVAVSVWSDEDMIGKFTDSYVAKAKDSYGADAASYGPEGPASAMDDWIGSRTGGAIGAIGRDPSGASSVLASALDLRAAWQDAFEDAGGRYGGAFKDAAGDGMAVGFMERTGECWYVGDDAMEAVAIPMDGGLTFVCFAGSRAGRFGRIADMRKETVHAVLPMFPLESSFDGKDLAGFLLSRGVSEAMDPLAANFYNMCQGSDWFMQEVLQEIRIETGPQGVGTSASGIGTVAPGGADPAEDAAAEEFVADGPFSFAIFSGFGTNSQYMLLYGQLMR